MLGRPLQRVHHRDAPQRVGPEVEDQRIPVGGDHGLGPAGQALCPGTRPGCRGAARPRRWPRRPARPGVSQAQAPDSERSGRRSWYCRSSAASRGSPQPHAVAVPVALEELAAWPPSRAWSASEAGSVSSALEAASQRSSTEGPHLAVVAQRRRGPGPRRTCGRRSQSSHWISRARRRRAVGEVDGTLQRQVGRDLVHGAHRVGERRGRGSGPASSSIMASTSAVVPSLRNVATSEQVGVADDDVEPAEALGVGVRLVAGVDDRPLQGGLEADHLLEELGALGDLVSRRRRRRWPLVSAPTLPAPAKSWRITKCGTMPATTWAKGTSRSIR